MKNKPIVLMLLAVMLLTSMVAAGLSEEEIMLPQLTFAKKDLPDLDSFRFVEELGVGWNLGNTFDASNAHHVKDELDYESAWVGVKTDARVFKALKNVGFKAVRIPISWHNHVSGDDFRISERWLNRVKDVVDMALAEGLFVIINTHHDIEKDYLYPDKAHLDNSKRYLTAIWEQVAPVFVEYDEHLIMESMNEPRLTGTPIEWNLDPNDPRSAEAVQCINALNQVFVDIVRDTGGNNTSRYLLVPGYAASVQGCLHNDFLMPADTGGVNDRLLLSVHAYTPYDFALQSPKEKGSRDNFKADNPFDVEEIAKFMNQLYDKFTPQNVPIVIGEFGCRDKGGNLQSRVDFTAVYVALARARGFSCFWWDNHAFSGDGEVFGILDRKTFAFTYPDIAQALVQYSR